MREHAPAGLAIFNEKGTERVALIARRPGLPFHGPEAAQRLEDKLYQREAVRVAGLPTRGMVALSATADRATVERLGASIGHPGVLKPRRASGGRHPYPVSSANALGEHSEDVAAEEPEDMLVEEYLPGGLPCAHVIQLHYSCNVRPPRFLSTTVGQVVDFHPGTMVSRSSKPKLGPGKSYAAAARRLRDRGLGSRPYVSGLPGSDIKINTRGYVRVKDVVGRREAIRPQMIDRHVA